MFSLLIKNFPKELCPITIMDAQVKPAADFTINSVYMNVKATILHKLLDTELKCLKQGH